MVSIGRNFEAIKLNTNFLVENSPVSEILQLWNVTEFLGLNRFDKKILTGE